MTASRVAVEMVRKQKENTVRDVVLVQDLGSLGKKGEIVSVKKGYFRNYLLPYGIAEVATQELLEKVAAERAQREAEEAAALEGCREQAATIEAVCGGGAITILRKAGPDGKLFGSVTAAEVAEVVADRSGVQVDKKDVEVPHVSEAGSYIVRIKLHPKVDTTVNILVVGQE